MLIRIILIYYYYSNMHPEANHFENKIIAEIMSIRFILVHGMVKAPDIGLAWFI